MDETAHAKHRVNAQVIRGAASIEEAHARGRYEVECIGSDGELKWRDAIENTVVTVGRNLALDTFLGGTAYSVVGPYMGLISSVSFAAIVVGDTMASHPGWTEAGGLNAPSYAAPRKLCAWAAASAGSKALSAALSFAITGVGTVKGAFILFGAGAVSTIDNPAGTLYSAGLFSGGDKVVGNGDTLSISYSASM
jgi:hypothetical protein